MKTIRVAIADSQQMCVDGIAALLCQDAGIEVVGATYNFEGLQPLLASCRPDVIVVDPLEMGSDAVEVVASLRKQFSSTQMVVLTRSETPQLAVRILRAGALGYVLKRVEFAHLRDAIRSAFHGKRYVCRVMADLVLDSYFEEGASLPESGVTLSKREVEVLDLVADGCTYNQIADRLFISVRTVESHRARISRKLGLRTQADLIRFALLRRHDLPNRPPRS